MREAIKRLETEGLVKIIPNKGAAVGVVPFTIPEDIEVALKGIPIDEELIGKKIEEVTRKPDVKLGFIEPKDFVRVIMEAIEKVS